MLGAFGEDLRKQIEQIRDQGLYKDEHPILSPQSSRVRIPQGPVINFCANNYLGLANHPKIIEAAKAGLEQRGYGMASVRFICGTQDIHKRLEEAISYFLGTEDTILYSSCFDANTGLFETLLTEQDAIISDELNHASIIDGIRLSKAKRLRYRHADMGELEQRLREAQECRARMIATDGVFSMDGDMTPLDRICELARKYEAMVTVDDSHATGFVGPTGRGTPEHFGVQEQVDVITSTLGKALGGASGGFASGRREIVEYLRQRSRPYLFSNTLAPPIVNASLKALELLAEKGDERRQLWEKTRFFRQEMKRIGFNIVPGDHPIVPIMLGDAGLAQGMAARLLEEGIYAVGFFYPVVPMGKARIRIQVSASHSMEDLRTAIGKFEQVGRELGVIS
jgi:glycine C-acetyltransferase